MQRIILEHKYVKRLGQADRRNLCPICCEGGDLLGCKKCETKFHLGCHSPPYTEQDKTSGEWMCRLCIWQSKFLTEVVKTKGTNVYAIAEALESASSYDVSTVELESKQSLLESFKKPLPPREIGKKAVGVGICTTKRWPGEDIFKKPVTIQEYRKTARKMIRSSPSNNDKENQGEKKPIMGPPLEAHNDRKRIPLVCITCYYCQKSCRKSVLVKCDYCSLHYHPSCLRPPMKQLPRSIWMCPNHDKNSLDYQVVKSNCQPRERVRLWVKYSEPAEEGAYKRQVFRHLNMPDPPFRSTTMPYTIDVPAVVKHCYQNPPPMDPTPSCRKPVDDNQQAMPCTVTSVSMLQQDILATVDKDLDILRSAKAKCRSLQKELANMDDLANSSNDEEEDSEEVLSIRPANTKLKPPRRNRANILRGSKVLPIGEQPIDANENFENIPPIDEDMRYLDVDVIKMLAFQRLQQIIQDNPELVRGFQFRTATRAQRQLNPGSLSEGEPLDLTFNGNPVSVTEDHSNIAYSSASSDIYQGIYNIPPSPAAFVEISDETFESETSFIDTDISAMKEVMDFPTILPLPSNSTNVSTPAGFIVNDELSVSPQLSTTPSASLQELIKFRPKSNNKTKREISLCYARPAQEINNKRVRISRSSNTDMELKQGLFEMSTMPPPQGAEIFQPSHAEAKEKVDNFPLLVTPYCVESREDRTDQQKSPAWFTSSEVDNFSTVVNPYVGAKRYKVNYQDQPSRTVGPSFAFCERDEGRNEFTSTAAGSAQQKTSPKSAKPIIRTRAVLAPLGDRLANNDWYSKIDINSCFFMRYRTMNIGYGQSSLNDVDLSKVGFCRRISRKHATIFYDEYTRTYELINYSEFGTEVNGLIYSVDFTDYNPNGTTAQLMKAVAEKSVFSKPQQSCNCKSARPMVPGAWEGSALLTHGSLVCFGCLAFVFSVPNA